MLFKDKMNSRERVIKAINHQKPDRVPVDLGSTGQTGINASSLYRLRKALDLEDKPVTVVEPFQMLGMVDEDIRKALGIDLIALNGTTNFFGVKNGDWKPWFMPDGTPVYMAGGFEYDVECTRMHICISTG